MKKNLHIFSTYLNIYLSRKVTRRRCVIIRILLFGAPTVVLNDQTINLGLKKAYALLAYLAVTGKPQTREALGDLLWPDLDEPSAKAALRRTLSVIRGKLGGDILTTEDNLIELPESPNLSVDVVEFDSLIRELRESGAADREKADRVIGFYRGTFMKGFALRDAVPFENWQFYTAENLEHTYTGLLEEMTEHGIAETDPGSALEYARKRLELAPTDEEVHRSMIRIYALLGRREEAVRQYRQCERILRTELQEEPDEETRELFEEVSRSPRKARYGGTAKDSPGTRDKSKKKRYLLVSLPLAAAAVAAVLLVSVVLPGRLPPKKPSLVVLPLKGLNEGEDQAWFASGMTDSLTTRISQLSGLRVISNTSAVYAAETTGGVPEIANLLDVDYVVEGSVIRVRDFVRISIQLIDSRRDEHLWAKEYTDHLDEVLYLHASIARDVADQVMVKLTAQEEKRFRNQPRSVDPAAQEAYLRGFYYEHILMSLEGNEIGRKYYEQAVELDPNYVMGYLGLANYYWGEVQFAEYSAREGMPRAKEYVRKALEVDPDSAEAHTIQGFLHFLWDWDWKSSEKEFLTAIELNPNYAEAYRWYGSLLGTLQRYDEAIAATEKAFSLDPISPLNAVNAAARYYTARRYDEAMAVCNELIEAIPGFWLARWVLSWCYTQKGMHEEAVEEMKQTLEGVGLESLYRLGYTYGAAGRQDEARAVLGQIEEIAAERYVPSYYFAVVYTGLGEKDRAFEYLDKGFEERDMHLPWEVRDPVFDSLRVDPRWSTVLERLDLEPFDEDLLPVR